MTPKEKADIIFMNMRMATHTRVEGSGVLLTMAKQAKSASLTCVEEIQEQIGKYYHEVKVKGVIGIEAYFQIELEFWNEVKKQIDLL